MISLKRPSSDNEVQATTLAPFPGSSAAMVTAAMVTDAATIAAPSAKSIKADLTYQATQPCSPPGESFVNVLDIEASPFRWFCGALSDCGTVTSGRAVWPTLVSFDQA